MYRVLRVMHASVTEAVELASFRLRDVVVLWYEAWERSRGPDAPPAEWEDFSEAFLAHYLPREVREARLDLFLSLKQGDMSVRVYSHKFNSLARYAPDIVRTMRARVHHYVDGLGDHLIRDCRVASLSDDVDISRIQAFAQTTEDLSRRIRDTRRDREQSKRARTMGSYRETRDPGSTFSYITPFIDGKLDMRSELLPQSVEVSTPVGDSIIANHDYDVDILYHPGKANIVANALSRKSMGSLSHVEADKVKMTKYLCHLANLQVRLVDAEGGRILVQNTAKSSLVTEVKERQHEDPELIKLRERIPQQRQPLFELTGDGVLRYQGRLCVPTVGELRAKILLEAHYFRYAVHPGATKMYRDLRLIYWWNGMKKDIAEMVAQ
ncbi:uncharacterized protein LOC107766740 [Nicotiana tabacum]|uniref:Uncharacterized protein LOC107766740 n=1 Tax=Nicotiana tabacum TaxID=4097 RepID=A0AC58UR70_TOBAC